MKKVLTSILAAVLVLTLTACASQDEGSDQSSSTNTSTSSKSSTSGDYPDKISSFNSTDINGQSVTNEIFKEKKFTVINFWGTYCTPCINEMSDLQEWAEEMDEDVQLVGVVIDVKDVSDAANDTAKSIVESTGVKFTNIIAAGGLTNFASSLVGVPTTIVVDEEGNRVGDPIVGAQLSAYKDALDEAIFNSDK